MLTIESIRKPRNVSGFKQVGLVRGPSRGNTRPYYQAYANAGRRGDWKGPSRQTAAEAAQDYCDHVNGRGVAAPATLKSAGHVARRKRVARDPEERAALGFLKDKDAQRAGKQGYVYLIAEDLIGGGLHFGKVGYSTNPAARVAELQTGNPRKLKLISSMKGTPEDEAALHSKYAHKNVLQEWFLITKELLLEFPVEGAVR